MKKILILAEFYLPGYKAGGPIRTLSNMIEKLAGEFEFKVVALDRDYLDTQSYPNIKLHTWNRVGKAEVYYVHSKKVSFKMLRKLIRETEHDVLYLNSFFSPEFTMKPLMLRWLGFVPKVPVALAPRGEFAKSALGIKNFKKKIYIRVAKAIGLYKDIIWQASSAYEAKDIREKFGENQNIHIALDIPFCDIDFSEHKIPSLIKKAGNLKMLFLSRIAHMKNLVGALEILKHIEGNIEFDIYGIQEDKKYWEKCEKLIKELPENVKVKYRGVVPYDRVKVVFQDYHLFFLPTLGENFGHAIFESLLGGCPVLISDRTSWRDLEQKKVGWDLPLEEPKKFRRVLAHCVNMSHGEYEILSKNAKAFGNALMQSKEVLEQNRQLFLTAVD